MILVEHQGSKTKGGDRSRVIVKKISWRKPVEEAFSSTKSECILKDDEKGELL
ncbi:hypothetical protein MTR_0010s0200 [Medicago truncatula]|uniref:Uncharacterized protein n=1 Tax=Medicago truncatula TaxID=3880 RepID=A0A072TVE5_MEDTR|nr:hypothetical protein MTR_0010s0200 [Medicago truncatula]